jgi:hypothetical protein
MITRKASMAASGQAPRSPRAQPQSAKHVNGYDYVHEHVHVDDHGFGDAYVDVDVDVDVLVHVDVLFKSNKRE